MGLMRRASPLWRAHSCYASPMRSGNSVNTGLAIAVLAGVAILAAYFIVRVASRDHASVTNMDSAQEYTNLQDQILTNQYPH